MAKFGADWRFFGMVCSPQTPPEMHFDVPNATGDFETSPFWVGCYSERVLNSKTIRLISAKRRYRFSPFFAAFWQVRRVDFMFLDRLNSIPKVLECPKFLVRARKINSPKKRMAPTALQLPRKYTIRNGSVAHVRIEQSNF